MHTSVRKNVAKNFTNTCAKRITEMLENASQHTVEEFIEIQYDVFSLQAKLFLEILFPLLQVPQNDCPGAKILQTWDARYNIESKGAWLFEKFYRGLLQEIFGKISSPKGENPICYLLDQCSTFITFYANFDAALLRKNSVWFAGKTREEMFQEVFSKTIVPLTEKQIQTWKEHQKIMLTNILFDGKMPKFLGFDHGPIFVAGGRATPSQGQVYKNAGRNTTFMPSLRFIVDMSLPGIKSHMLGGPSDRRFSRWYTSEVQMWATKKFKTLP